MIAVEWESFARGLAETLAGLPAGALVVISEPGEGGERRGRFVQFAQEPDRLIAEVVANSFVPAAKQASTEGERAISEAGWLPPEPAADRFNWNSELAWPASARQYQGLAEKVVVALRDGYGIADPDAFWYEAWNERKGNDDIELPRLGLPAAP